VTRLAYILPLFALAIVAGVGSVLFASSRGGRNVAASASSATAEPAAARSGERPALAPGQTVCQGILHLPKKGEAQTFPAVYTQRVQAKGISIVASARVSPKALDEAVKTVDRLFENNHLVDPLVEEGAYIIIAERGESLLALPEFACLARQAARGLVSHACGITDRADYPVVAVNEADMLGESRGPCLGMNVLYHELGHMVQNWSLPPADWFDVKQFYADALAAGHYRDAYAATNPDEYFAEAT
jgi:hypothetical protein